MKAVTSRTPAAILHILATLGLATALVVLPIPINILALAPWIILVSRWVKSRTHTNGWPAATAELTAHLAVMSLLVLAAASAPVKISDQRKARHITLPKRAFTIGELKEPATSNLRPPFFYAISAPDDLADQVVQFPARDLTVGEFIAAIEEQTPLRHRFMNCGNGSTTILWGGNCAFGLLFHLESPIDES